MMRYDRTGNAEVRKARRFSFTYSHRAALLEQVVSQALFFAVPVNR
jgi:hypothetical protein